MFSNFCHFIKSIDSDISSTSDKSDLSGYVPDSREKIHPKSPKEIRRSRRKLTNSRRKKKLEDNSSDLSIASSEGEEEDAGHASDNSNDMPKEPLSAERLPVENDYFVTSPSRGRRGKPRSLSSGRARRPRRRSTLSNSRSKALKIDDLEGGGGEEVPVGDGEGQGHGAGGSDEENGEEETPTKKPQSKGAGLDFQVGDLNAALAGLSGVSTKGEEEEDNNSEDEAGEEEGGENNKKKNKEDDLLDLKNALSGLGDDWGEKPNNNNNNNKRQRKVRVVTREPRNTIYRNCRHRWLD